MSQLNFQHKDWKQLAWMKKIYILAHLKLTNCEIKFYLIQSVRTIWNTSWSLVVTMRLTSTQETPAKKIVQPLNPELVSKLTLCFFIWPDQLTTASTLCANLTGAGSRPTVCSWLVTSYRREAISQHGCCCLCNATLLYFWGRVVVFLQRSSVDQTGCSNVTSFSRDFLFDDI